MAAARHTFGATVLRYWVYRRPRVALPMICVVCGRALFDEIPCSVQHSDGCVSYVCHWDCYTPEIAVGPSPAGGGEDNQCDS